MAVALCRGTHPSNRFLAGPTPCRERSTTFAISGHGDSASISPIHTIDNLPPGTITTCYTATGNQDGSSFKVVLSHVGLRPGPSSVHVLNSQVGLLSLPLVGGN